eukprot:1150765-Pelagomonas_calceolata.AAC.3
MRGAAGRNFNSNKEYWSLQHGQGLLTKSGLATWLHRNTGTCAAGRGALDHYNVVGALIGSRKDARLEAELNSGLPPVCIISAVSDQRIHVHEVKDLPLIPSHNRHPEDGQNLRASLRALFAI